MQFNFPISPREAGKGTLISFLSLRSGAGASTLACMCALTMVKHYRTAIIDFNHESKIRSYLGYQDLESSNVSILDINSVSSPDGIFSTSESHHSGLIVFPGVSPRTLDAAQIDANLILKATTYCKQSNELTIAVLNPLHTSSWIAAMLSDSIFLICKPDRPNQDAFRETVDFLKRLGCSDRLKIILNQVDYPGCIEKEGALSIFAPDNIIKYDKKIPFMCNRRLLAPNKYIRNVLFSLAREVIEE